MPPAKSKKGKELRWCRMNPLRRENKPTSNASMIMPDSNQKLWMMLTPKTDNPVRKTGKTAQ